MTTLAARQLITAHGVMDYPVLTLEGGRILAVSSRDAAEVNDITHHFPEATLTAGLLDIHVHGAANHDVMEGTPAAIHTVAAYLASRGTTEFLATTVTAAIDPTLRALGGIADAIESTPEPDAAQPVGIHLEGPFVSHVKRGVHPTEFIVPPTVELFDRFWQASRGHIRLMTIAPELPNAIEVIRHAVNLGVRVSLGHSNATLAEATPALAAGATSATHIYNAMRALDHREPGILGMVLDSDQLYAELICDGIHVAPELVRLWLHAKGPNRAILVTDGMAAMGMPDGTYMLGSFEVTVENGRCLSHGHLAGSVLTLDKAIANFQQMTHSSLATAVRLATANPAAMLGLDEALQPGAPANFNVYAGNKLQKTILRGRLLAH